MQRNEILRRYRHLRSITRHHSSGILRCVAQQTLLERARDIGCCSGRSMIFDSEEEAALVMDLAVHTANPGRSRAVDRYAKAASLPAGSDEALVLAAMVASRFSIWDVKRPHEEAGLIITDTMRDSETEIWLVDEGLELSADPGMLFAARLYLPGDFAMTSGVLVPIDPDILDAAFAKVPGVLDMPTKHIASDSRFNTAVYRAAIGYGIMDNVEFKDCGLAA